MSDNVLSRICHEYSTIKHFTEHSINHLIMKIENIEYKDHQYINASSQQSRDLIKQ